jgi:hypothetical protein
MPSARHITNSSVGGIVLYSGKSTVVESRGATVVVDGSRVVLGTPTAVLPPLEPGVGDAVVVVVVVVVVVTCCCCMYGAVVVVAGGSWQP